MNILCETEIVRYVVLFLYCSDKIDKSKKKEKKKESSCLRALPGVPWLLFLSYGNTTSEVHFALWCTMGIFLSCVTDCLLRARQFKEIKEGSSCKKTPHSWILLSGKYLNRGGFVAIDTLDLVRLWNLSVLLKLNLMLPLEPEICLHSQQPYLK